MNRARWVLSAVVVALLAATACGSDGAKKAATAKCPTVQAADDPAYSVQVAEPATKAKPVRLTVTRAGRPLTGAEVCVSSVMVGMEDMKASGHTTEVLPGAYEVDPGFEMKGQWTGTVTISESGRPPVAKPVTIEVKS